MKMTHRAYGKPIMAKRTIIHPEQILDAYFGGSRFHYYYLPKLFNMEISKSKLTC